MENQPLFGASVNEVNVNQEGTLREQMRARDIGNSKSNYVDVGKLMGQAAQVLEAEKTVEANTAKEDYIALKTSQGYLDADDARKAEMLEEVYASMGDRSKSYQSSMRAYSQAEYSKVYDGRIEIETNAAYNGAPAAYMAWEDEPSGKVDEEGNPISNKDAGRTREDFINDYHKNHPTWDKKKTKLALVTEQMELINLDISQATTRKELNEALENAKEIEDEFDLPLFYRSKDAHMQSIMKNNAIKRENAVKAAKNNISIAAKNRIEQAGTEKDYNVPWEDLAEDAAIVATDSKTGKIDDVKFNKIKDTYLKEQKESFEYESYYAGYNPEDQLSPQAMENKKIMKDHKNNIAGSVVNQVYEGSEKSLINTVQANANFLSEGKAMLTNFLYNTKQAGPDQDTLWANLDDIMQSPEGYAAIKTIFGKEDTSKLRAVMIAQRYGGRTREQAIEAVDKMMSNPDEYKVREKSVNETITELGVEYGPLNDEFRTTVMLAVATGMDAKTVVKAIQEDFDKRITEVNDVVAFNVTGTAPEVSENAAPIYEKHVGKVIDGYVEQNGGNPVYLEVLNDGKAIVRDATFGWKLPGHIDLGYYSNRAEKLAVAAGPDAWDKAMTWIDTNIISRTTNSLEEATKNGKGDLGVLIDIYKYFTEDAKPAEEVVKHQSTEGKEKMNEKSVAVAEKPQEDPEQEYNDFVGELFSKIDADELITDEQEKNNIIELFKNIGKGEDNVGGASKIITSQDINETYADVLITNEGNYNNASFLHKPSEGSGWTIANGLDAAFTSADEMRKLGVPERIVKYIEQNKAFGTTDVPLPKGQKSKLRMTKEEFRQVNVNIAKKSEPEIREYLDSNPKLDKTSAAYLAQIKHWAGSFKSNKESKTTRRINGKLVSPIHDLINSGNATREGLVKALETIKKSFLANGDQKRHGGKGTYRLRTVKRYIENLMK